MTSSRAHDGLATSRRWGVQLLGGFSVSDESGPVRLPPACERIVALIALSPPWRARAEVAGLIRRERAAERPDGPLRTALWRSGALAPGLVRARNGRVSLADGVLVDWAIVRADLVAALTRSSMGLPPPVLGGWCELLP